MASQYNNMIVTGKDIVSGSLPLRVKSKNTEQEFNDGTTWGRILRLERSGQVFFDFGIDQRGHLFINTAKYSATNHVLSIAPDGHVTITGDLTVMGNLNHVKEAGPLMSQLPDSAFAASTVYAGRPAHWARVGTNDTGACVNAGTGQYVQVDLGGARTFNKIMLRRVGGNDVEYARQLDIQVSSAGNTFQTIATVRPDYSAGREFSLDLPEATGRYVRAAVAESSGTRCDAIQFELYGS